MKKEQVQLLFDRFEQARYLFNEIECWSARDLQQILGYSDWRNFLKAVTKAKEACHNSGEATSDHFVEANKMITLGKGGERKVEDIGLTRYACYLVAQNGDSSKNEVAFAQTYFAVQTRKQEIIEKGLLDLERISAREKLSKSEKKLSGIIYERGVDEKGFALIRSRGDKALFGGFTTNDMKQKLLIPLTRPLADFLPTLTIKAKDFATELTSHNVVEKDLKGQEKISGEHIDNNLAIRKMLQKRGVQPEKLPPAEDIAKIKRKLYKEEKKTIKKIKKSDNNKGC